MRNATTALALILGLAAAPAFGQAGKSDAPASATVTGCMQAGAQASPEAFNTLDDNGDGFVSEQEYIEKCGRAGVAAKSDEVAKAQFAALDADRDARLSQDEYKAPAQALANAGKSDAGATASAGNSRVDRPTQSASSGPRQDGNGALAGVDAERLVGMDVVNAKGEEVGEVRDLVLDSQQDAHAVVSVGGFLGIGAKNVAIPFKQLRVGPDRVTLMSETTADELKRMPAYSKEDYTPVARDDARNIGPAGRPSPTKY